MDLDEAIKHCEEVADTPCFTDEEARCYSEHRQLAEWLKELKTLKVSRKEFLNDIDMAIKAANMDDAYSVGMRNGMRVIKAFIDDEKPEYEKCCHEENKSEIQTSCEDAISRQAAIRAIEALQRPIMREESNYYQFKFSGMSEALGAVENLPSVTPQQRMGRWIPTGYDGYADGNPVYDWWECSECGWEHTGDEESLTAFCPDCGAKMEVEE